MTTLDISRTFVDMVAENARAAGVQLTACHGDASRMPFADASFDMVLCQAAFKNFSRPQASVNEMHRVLRVGGQARIADLRRDAPDRAIRAEVDGMELGSVRSWMTARALKSLRRRAYLATEFEDLATASPFRTWEITTDPLGLEARLSKRSPAPEGAPSASFGGAAEIWPRNGAGRCSGRPPLAVAGLQRTPFGSGLVL